MIWDVGKADIAGNIAWRIIGIFDILDTISSGACSN